MKKISIMITSYNLVDYIDVSINSVVSQEMPCDWELLIGDDGSTDGTIEKLQSWHERYPANIRYWVNERPKSNVKDGYRAGKNRAGLLERASGDYLIYLDGDDCWLGTEKLKAQFAILENPANADCSCCAHNILAYVISENRKYSWIKEDMPSQKLTLKQYWSHYYFHTNTNLFRKECKQMLLDPLYRMHLNDNFITYILLQFGKVYYLDKVWAQYNMTGQGLWTGHKKIYGMFRNMTLYDLEKHVNHNLSKEILAKHSTDIEYIIKNYTLDDYNAIQPVISVLDPKVFVTTLAFANMDNSLKFKWQKCSLQIQILSMKITRKIKSLLKL